MYQFWCPFWRVLKTLYIYVTTIKIQTTEHVYQLQKLPRVIFPISQSPVLLPDNHWSIFCHCGHCSTLFFFSLASFIYFNVFGGSAILLCVSVVHFFFIADLYCRNRPTVCLSIHLLVGIWVVSSFWICLITLLWTFMYMCFCVDICFHLFLLGKYLVVKLLSCVSICLTLEDSTKPFPKLDSQFYTAYSNDWDF